ncbi:glycosyltransferase [Dickeya poaceiphila]|uniref:Glycosyltransferase family 4 protein n=1 Tax=Dickeya poaceiphila TaxID=568768 RepID=A0A5B8IAZ5_9GAMM|nr:glycosyltransferase [Dickeya poaceiphila]QDX31263.1 glycosyltransferase family 4 protein [Dickeya poaceiphila]
MKVSILIMNACDIGGIERSTFSLMNALRKNNICVEMVSLFENETIGLGVNEEYVIPKGCNEFLKILNYVRSVSEDTTIISTYDRLSIFVIAASFLLRKRVNLIAQQHADYFALKWWTRTARRIMYNLGNVKIVCLTRKDYSFYKKWHDSVYQVPNILDLSHKIYNEVPSLASRHIDLLAAGRLHPVKRFEDFIGLVEFIHKERDITAKLYGSGDDLNRLQRCCNSSLDIFAGATDELMKKMYDAKIVVVTSHRESFSMVILEAMSAGCVVVSYDCPTGPSELITNGVDGFLVENGNTSKLKETCMLLLENIALCETISINAQKTARKYSPDIIAKQWSMII